MDVMRVMHERRSIRRFRPDPVSKEIIIEILEAARRAPSWANTQASRFVVVEDQRIKEALRDTLSPNNPARKAMVEAPVLICLFAKKFLSGYHQGKPATDKGDWLMFDAGIAMEHLALAAWNFGLGTVHIGFFDAKAVQTILQIPDEFNVVEITPVGYFDEVPKETPRRPLAESVFLDSYGLRYIK